jgi:hypothetical protein
LADCVRAIVLRSAIDVVIPSGTGLKSRRFACSTSASRLPPGPSKRRAASSVIHASICACGSPSAGSLNCAPPQLACTVCHG